MWHALRPAVKKFHQNAKASIRKFLSKVATGGGWVSRWVRGVTAQCGGNIRKAKPFITFAALHILTLEQAPPWRGLASKGSR